MLLIEFVVLFLQMSSDLEICEILQSLEDNVICTICGCAPKPGLQISGWYHCFKRHLICSYCVKINEYNACTKCNEPIGKNLFYFSRIFF